MITEMETFNNSKVTIYLKRHVTLHHWLLLSRADMNDILLKWFEVTVSIPYSLNYSCIFMQNKGQPVLSYINQFLYVQIQFVNCGALMQ